MTKLEKQWIADIVSMGCVVCRNLNFGESPAVVHHIRATAGAGQRAGHTETIPLCPNHHTNGGYGVAFHAGPRVFEQYFGTELELLEQTKEEVKILRKAIRRQEV